MPVDMLNMTLSGLRCTPKTHQPVHSLRVISCGGFNKIQKAPRTRPTGPKQVGNNQNPRRETFAPCYLRRHNRIPRGFKKKKKKKILETLSVSGPALLTKACCCLLFNRLESNERRVCSSADCVYRRSSLQRRGSGGVITGVTRLSICLSTPSLLEGGGCFP